MPDEYEWVNRHTWQSWRERYKRHQEEFDPIIERMAEQLNPSPRRTYDLNRKAGKSYRQPVYYIDSQDEEEEEDNLLATRGEADAENSEEHRAPRRRSHTNDERPAQRRRTQNDEDPEEMPTPSRNKGKQRAREQSVSLFDSEL